MLSDPELELMVRAAPSAACEARRAVARSRLVADSQQATLLLLVSELVSNSVRHAGLRAGEPIRLVARCDDDRARVEVCDAGRSGRVPGKREPTFGELEPGGLGLMLVDEMADRWGVSCDGDGTCVWFELACAA
jgi:anti-sigma regulatory factor (Ser/Thr protein kinase)